MNRPCRFALTASRFALTVSHLTLAVSVFALAGLTPASGAELPSGVSFEEKAGRLVLRSRALSLQIDARTGGWVDLRHVPSDLVLVAPGAQGPEVEALVDGAPLAGARFVDHEVEIEDDASVSLVLDYELGEPGHRSRSPTDSPPPTPDSSAPRASRPVRRPALRPCASRASSSHCAASASATSPTPSSTFLAPSGPTAICALASLWRGSSPARSTSPARPIGASASWPSAMPPSA